MATVTGSFYAVSHVTGNASDPNNALGAPDGVFTTDGNENRSWTSRWRIDALPAGAAPSGTQAVRLRLRKGSNSGNPQLTRVEIWQNGSVVATPLSTAENVTTSADRDVTFAGSVLSGGALVDVLVQTSGASGGPNARNAVEIDSITWAAEYVPPNFAALVGAGQVSADIASSAAVTGTLVGFGALTADVELSGHIATEGGDDLTTESGTPLVTENFEPASDVLVSATLAGSGALTASIGASAATSAALAGSGALAASVGASVAASAALAGSGALAASVGASVAASAALAGSGALAASIQATADGEIAAALAGSGALTASVGALMPVSAALAGSGALTASVGALVPVSAALAGSGALTAGIGTAQPAAVEATLVGVGSASFVLASSRAVLASLTGAGQINATVGSFAPAVDNSKTEIQVFPSSVGVVEVCVPAADVVVIPTAVMTHLEAATTRHEWG